MHTKFFFIFAIIAGIVFACGQQETPGANAAAKAEAVAAKPDGEKLYKQYCVTCHGLYGNMGASGAYNLQKSELALEERINVITNGRNTMTAFKSLLSEERIRAVAEYTLELSKLDE